MRYMTWNTKPGYLFYFVNVYMRFFQLGLEVLRTALTYSSIYFKQLGLSRDGFEVGILNLVLCRNRLELNLLRDTLWRSTLYIRHVLLLLVAIVILYLIRTDLRFLFTIQLEIVEGICDH